MNTQEDHLIPFSQLEEVLKQLPSELLQTYLYEPLYDILPESQRKQLHQIAGQLTTIAPHKQLHQIAGQPTTIAPRKQIPPYQSNGKYNSFDALFINCTEEEKQQNIKKLEYLCAEAATKELINWLSDPKNKLFIITNPTKLYHTISSVFPIKNCKVKFFRTQWNELVHPREK